MLRRLGLTILAAALLPVCNGDSDDVLIGSAVEDETVIYDETLVEHLSREELEQLDVQGLNMLHRAASAGSPSFVEKVLASGADPNLRAHREGRDGMTALALACTNGHAEVAARLIASHADVDLTCPLVISASRGHVELVRMLLDAGADIDQQSTEMGDATALIAASMMGRLPL